MMPKQEIHLVLSQEVLVIPQLGHFIPSEIGSYYILVNSLQVCGELGCSLGQS